MALNTDLKVEELQLSEDMIKLPMLARYDEALRKLLSQVFAGNVVLAPVERAIELSVGQTRSKPKFPFISIFPTQGYTMSSNNFMQTNIGIPALRAAHIYNKDTLQKEGSTFKMQNFYQMMMFDIPYVISCWSTNRVQALQLIQELLFWLKAQGQVKVIYKEHKLNANLIISDTITDGSAYTSYADLGNLYRFDLTITIQAPVYRTANYLNITNTDFELKLKEDED